MSLASLLNPLCIQLEQKIKKEISGTFNLPKKMVYDRVMPLRVNVTAAAETCYFELLPGGSVQLHQGSTLEPDVTIRADPAVLKELILRQSKTFFENAEKQGAISVTANSWKGEQAVNQVRQAFSTMP